MLVENSYSNGDTISIKISSGEELVARLEEEKDDKIILYKPMMLVHDQKGMALAPYMFTVPVDAKFTLNLRNVICIVKTEKNMASKYIETTTGIKLG